MPEIQGIAKKKFSKSRRLGYPELRRRRPVHLRWQGTAASFARPTVSKATAKTITGNIRPRLNFRVRRLPRNFGSVVIRAAIEVNGAGRLNLFL
jgi:hypothetical protein